MWGLLTSLAAWTIGPRSDDPGPLEVLTVSPAHAAPTVPDPINPAARAQAQREQALTEAADRVHLLQAAALLDAARKATTTTTTAPRRVTTPRPPAAPVAPRTYAPGVEQWRSLVAQYPWPVDTMLAIMRCESGGSPLAQNRSSGAGGLFQLYPPPAGWQDPAFSIRYAYERKYAPSGLSPWVSSRGCW